MRRLRLTIGTLSVGALLLVAPPAGADDGSHIFTLSAASGTAGTTVQARSTVPCPAPPAGMTFLGVGFSLTDAAQQNLVGNGTLATSADRSFAGPIQVPAGQRNGRYLAWIACVAQDGTGAAAYSTDVQEFLVTSPAGTPDPVVRLAGDDRVLTAIAISKDLYQSDQSADVAVLSRADGFADAFGGGPLAAFEGGPLLLTGTASLDGRTRAELQRAVAPGGTIYVLGGSAALAPSIDTELVAAGFSVVRLAGANRFDTAVRIADLIGPPSAILLADGYDFRDGFVASAVAPYAGDTGTGVVLLTDHAVLPPETTAYLRAHAVPNFAVGANARTARPGVPSFVGTDPSDTSRLVAEHFAPDANEVVVATSEGFADSLTASAYAGRIGAPLLLTPPSGLSPSVRGFLTARKPAIALALVAGGTGVVPDAVRAAIVDAVS